MPDRPRPTYARSVADGRPSPARRTETTQSFQPAPPAQGVSVRGGRAAPTGASGAVVLAKVTDGGAAGSLTFENGILTAFVPPT